MTYSPFNASFWSGDNWQIILGYVGAAIGVVIVGTFIYYKIKASKKQIDDLQAEESASFKYLDKKNLKIRDIQVDVQKNGTVITYEYLPDGTMITNPPVVRTLVVTPEGYFMEERLVEDGQIGELIAQIGDYDAYVQPNPPENIRNNLMSLEENQLSKSNKYDLDSSLVSKTISQQTGIP
ncbi:MAG: hypothetical protein ACKPES_00620, partial [Dolichospermum sp.]